MSSSSARWEEVKEEEEVTDAKLAQFWSVVEVTMQLSK